MLHFILFVVGDISNVIRIALLIALVLGQEGDDS